jgi:biotin carboxyl carrier protein
MLGYQLIRKYELKLNDEIIPVTVEGANDVGRRVTISDTEFTVRITDIDREQGVFHVVVGDQKYTLKVIPQPDSQGYRVTLNKRDYTALLKPIASAASPLSSPVESATLTTISRPSAETVAVEPGSIVAPLPGRVIKLRVKEGASVKVGDVVIVLEAMKMANEIRAAKAGVVKQVHVQSGEAVEKGQPLITIG